MDNKIEKLEIVLVAVIYKYPYSEEDIKRFIDLFNEVNGEGMKIQLKQVSRKANN